MARGTPAIRVLSPAIDASPGCEVVGSRERRQHDELGERDPGLLRHRDRGVEGGFAIARQPEDERSRT